MSTFLIKRGKRALLRQARAHLARFDAHGQVLGAWCGYSGWNMLGNVPWGLKVCAHCARKAAAS